MEMNAQTLWETTLDPEVRVLKKIELNDRVTTNNVFSTLMGDSADERRRWLNKNISFETSEEEKNVDKLLQKKGR